MGRCKSFARTFAYKRKSECSSFLNALSLDLPYPTLYHSLACSITVSRTGPILVYQLCTQCCGWLCDMYINTANLQYTQSQCSEDPVVPIDGLIHTHTLHIYMGTCESLVAYPAAQYVCTGPLCLVKHWKMICFDWLSNYCNIIQS